MTHRQRVEILAVKVSSSKKLGRLLRRPLVLGLLAIGLFVLMGSWLLLRTPGWYDPPGIPESRSARQDVRNRLLQAEQSFTDSLLAGKPFVYHIYHDDVNLWIAMRKQIYPLIDEIAPPLLHEPQVYIERGSVVVGGRCDVGPFDAVVSMEIKPVYRDGAIFLVTSAVRCGSVPIPMGIDRLGLERQIQFAPEKLWPGSPDITGDFINGVRVDAEAWWKNGGTRYRVEGLTVVPGRIDLSIRPIGRQSEIARRRQASSP